MRFYFNFNSKVILVFPWGLFQLDTLNKPECIRKNLMQFLSNCCTRFQFQFTVDFPSQFTIKAQEWIFICSLPLSFSNSPFSLSVCPSYSNLNVIIYNTWILVSSCWNCFHLFQSIRLGFSRWMFLLEMRVEKIHRTLLLSPLLPLSLSCSPVPCVISSIAFGFGHSISHSVAVRFNYWESHKPKPPMLRGATYGRVGAVQGLG